MNKLKSAIIYNGPSLIDGAPIIAVATGLASSSANRKTGDMVQTWILRADIAPNVAVNSGADVSICGDCPHRGTIENGRNVNRSCYVLEFQAPLIIWRSVQRGSVPEVDASELGQLVAGRAVRLGSYGDPAAVPADVWVKLIKTAAGHTGYTHHWQTIQRHVKAYRTHPRNPMWLSQQAHLQKLCMASCDTLEQAVEARALGWRTFRVRRPEDRLTNREVVCPASKEGGEKLNCDTCKACNGTLTKRKGHIAIIAHGSTARAKNFAINVQ